MTFKVEDPVVKMTDDEEMVLLAMTTTELVVDAEDAVEVIEKSSLEVLGVVETSLLEVLEAVDETSLEVLEVVEASPLEVLETSLDVVDGATLLLLELLSASLILRAPLIPLLERALPSFCFM